MSREEKLVIFLLSLVVTVFVLAIGAACVGYLGARIGG